MRRLTRFIGLLTLIACGGDAVAPPAQLVGIWNLSSVDGQALPVNLRAASGLACGVDVMAGVIGFEAGGKFSGTETYGKTVNGQLFCNAVVLISGTYVSNGQTVTLTNTAGGGRSTLTLSGQELVKVSEARRYVYHK